MKKFLIKFCFVLAVFFVPACYYQYVVGPNISGDIGKLGMIPFGKNQEGLEVEWYHRDADSVGVVINISDPDSLRLFRTITIGDSFSQLTCNGYQYSISGHLRDTIVNFRGFPDRDVLENYLILLNCGYIVSGQTVILESVERSFVGRFLRIGAMESYCSIPDKAGQIKEEKQHTPFLNNYFSWIRLSAGYNNPIQSFSISKECFTHNKYSSILHIYNSKKSWDGDILWYEISADEYKEAGDNVIRMIDYSENKGINFYILIACDKYDAYEPWIVDSHDKNPTFENIPHSNRVFVSRECLRDAIEKGVKDVYKLNNTHWSVVGADIVGNSFFEWMVHSNNIH